MESHHISHDQSVRISQTLISPGFSNPLPASFPRQDLHVALGAEGSCNTPIASIWNPRRVDSDDSWILSLITVFGWRTTPRDMEATETKAQGTPRGSAGDDNDRL